MDSSEFHKIYEGNLWGDADSRSGIGSNLLATEIIRKELPYLFQKYSVESILDIPCGDFHWMKEMKFPHIDYIGADIVEPLIASNIDSFPGVRFEVLDITTDSLPCVDLILCRDLLGHLSNENIHRALDNISRSGSKYLLTTTLTRWDFCPDIEDGGWRCLNLLIPPFSLRPIYLINEDCQESYPNHQDKCLVLFDISKMRLDQLV
tara:strand:- start:2976 stop:3593 length:618 start_codon:yes stop_codon:yes gene_type:complete